MAEPGLTPSSRVAEPAGDRRGRRRWPVDVGAWAAFAALIELAGSRLAFTFEKEMEDGRGFLWLPVVFAVGILVYFALPTEPWLPALAGLTVALAVGAWRARIRIGAFRVLVVATAVAAGLLTAKLRTDEVSAPVLSREMTVTVTGWVAGLEEASRNGVRVILRVNGIEGVGADRPNTVRVTVRSRAGELTVGDAITMLASLTPPSGPVLPGGYDFARAAFYEGIGAYGFAYGAAEPADLGVAPLDIRVAAPLAHLRDTIRRRIEAALPGDPGHVAAALIMGDQGGIAETTQEAMRASGLGHVLSISGLHMALVAGTSFWLIRALLALSVGLALNRPIKKWAAGVALAVAVVYLGLSGAGVATQRAFIMLAIMLTAILIDRRAITLRNVALAALVVLVLSPDALLTASFQMSFAATAALIAAFEAISAWRDQRRPLNDARTLAGRVWWYVASLALTSLVAGLATAPFVAFHFQRLAPLSLVANLAAMPAVGFIVMPMALVAVLVMPFGLEVLPLTAMKWGLAWMGWVAEATAAWSTGFGNLPMAPAGALVLVVAGFLWLVLWRERWRLAGLAPMMLAVPLALAAARPDILVDASGTVAAVRGESGRLAVLNGKGADFEVEYWLRADGDARATDDPGLTEGVACDPLGCIARLDQAEVAVVIRADAFAEDCRRSAVIVSRFAAPAGCAAHALVIDRAALARFGAHALYREGGGFRVETAYPAVHRPFMPPRAE